MLSSILLKGMSLEISLLARVRKIQQSIGDKSETADVLLAVLIAIHLVWNI